MEGQEREWGIERAGAHDPQISGRDEPMRSTEISALLGEQPQLVDALEALVQQFEQHLDALLRPRGPEESSSIVGPDKLPSPVTELGKGLFQVNERLVAVTQHARAILNRLEL